jgi:hypothetical protein
VERLKAFYQPIILPFPGLHIIRSHDACCQITIDTQNLVRDAVRSHDEAVRFQREVTVLTWGASNARTAGDRASTAIRSCVYCGGGDGRTSGHVPPRSIFPKLRPSLITVPLL